ncbi:5896_t:CDS:2 [Diversispora eburnea]|uniref:5896_t:CDS:1 n=1 Tax=Diversispora eburnea TaxID=1213867 RepID=A0A9N9FSL0_9GLOM|nr:5896_t:CDS:2 [Diversispora eburnea]
MSLQYNRKDSFKSALKSALKRGLIKEFNYNTFKNITEIARGGYGTVYRANSTGLGKHVALKSLYENENSELFFKKFVKELTNITAVNNHDNIINFYGVSIDPLEETYYLVLQYAKDGNLRTYLRNNFESLNWKTKIKMAKDITSGLRCIHEENIVHKDLYSKNILVHEGRLLITDLGLSQLVDANSKSMGGGVAAYTDPRYLRDQMKYKRDKSSDIYSLGVLFWELSSGRPPFHNIPPFTIYKSVTSGEREKPVNETPRDYIDIYSSAWEDDPNKRPTVGDIFKSLENIKLENIYDETNDNHDIQLDETNGNQHIQLEANINNQSQTSTDAFSRDSISSASYTTSNWKEVTGDVGEAVKPFIPLIEAVTLVISEIIKVYEAAQYNKKICNSLMDRVIAAEAAFKSLKRRQTENELNFRNQEYYYSFIRFIEIMKRIKNFMIDISSLFKYQKFVHSGSVKDRFNSLVEDFDVIMTELHFTMAFTNEEQRRIDQSALESDISDMTKFLERIGGGIIDENKKINIVLREVSLMREKLYYSDVSDKNIKATEIESTELSDPLTLKPTDGRGRNRQVIKKIYQNFEVACKPINLQNNDPKEAARIQGHLAILGNLRDSPNIIRFYGLSYIENSDVTVTEWAEYGSLRDLYCKFDIALHGKVQIALGICRGLTFLHSCDILHHDIRCEHIMMATGLVPKIAKFKYSREASGPTTDMKGVTDITHWMAPEKLRDSTKNHVPYTFKCEIFSFGMLLWELVFEKMPYESWNIMEIKEHVLAGKRERITLREAPPDVQKVQKGLAKIIMSAWRDDPEIRASLQNIYFNLDQLADEYCSPDKECAPVLLSVKPLDLDGSLSRVVSVSDEGGFDLLDINFNIDEISQIIPLEEGIAEHRKREHVKAWECFLAHADLGNATAKYWKGYYLWEGIVVEKDREQASRLFKEAADEEIAAAQLRYAISLINNPLVKFDREIFLKYLTKSADNNNPTAQFNLGEVYLYGKLNQKKDEELGIKYLRLAALNDQPKAKELLKKLGIDN